MRQKSVKDSIPNLGFLYEKVKNFVKKNQGEKGYINVQQRGRRDAIYGFGYEGEYGVEVEVVGVRVIDERLEVLAQPIFIGVGVVWDDESFRECGGWTPLRDGTEIIYVPTLFNIAESIEQYVEG